MPAETEKPNHDTVMDVTEERIARVYATAFMEVASKSSDPTALVDEVSSLVTDVLDRFPRLEDTLRSALVSAEQKEQVLDRLFKGRTSTTVLNFLKVLARHDRLEILRTIARLLTKLDFERRGLIAVELRVAAPISDELRTEIENRVRKAFGGEPQLNTQIDPSLIAGFVVRIGDRVFDGSINTRLEHARRAMIERITEKIETQPDRFVGASNA
jgi:F-type H+-transporting ATPase subunit delta